MNKLITILILTATILTIYALATSIPTRSHYSAAAEVVTTTGIY